MVLPVAHVMPCITSAFWEQQQDCYVFALHKKSDNARHKLQSHQHLRSLMNLASTACADVAEYLPDYSVWLQPRKGALHALEITQHKTDDQAVPATCVSVG